MKTFIALLMYRVGLKPMISTFIDEDTITMSYGHLHSIGYFEYSLPPKIVKKIHGTTSWNELIKNNPLK